MDEEERFTLDDDDPRPYEIFCVPMATALAHIHSEDGLVIAADGNHHLRLSTKELKLVSDHAQKVFHLSGADREAACSFFGRVTLINDADERAFNFVSACHDAAKNTASQTVETADEWAELICPRIVESLAAVKERGALSNYPSPEPREPGRLGRTLTTIFVDGYFQGEPFRTEMRIYHRDQQLGWEVGGGHHDLSAWRKTRLYGSPVVADRLFKTDDSRFDRYRNEACKRVSNRCFNPGIVIRLADAVEAARSFIQACSDPFAKELEGDAYQRVGGHLQLATMTPIDGFKWIERPEDFDPL